jgi:hypothetical protein
MRALSLTAIEQYRKNAKNNANLDLDILKLKINALISASSNVYPVPFGTIYQFGSCKIKVNLDDIVTSITWTSEKIDPSPIEIKRLETYNLRYGLDKRGNRFATKEEQNEFEQKQN